MAVNVIDLAETLARILNQPNALDRYSDGELETLSKVFNQLGNKLWKHRWSDTREERHRKWNGGSHA